MLLLNNISTSKLFIYRYFFIHNLNLIKILVGIRFVYITLGIVCDNSVGQWGKLVYATLHILPN